MSSTTKMNIRLVFLLKFFVLGFFAVVVFAFFPRLFRNEAANLTSVSDTLSSSRLSFYGLMGAGNTVGSTLITINTTTAPSTSSSQLASPSASVAVKIGTHHDYTLDKIMQNGNEALFSVTSGQTLQTGDQTAGVPIIATQSASHTVKFTTATAVPNGSIRVLVQATANTGSSNDGIPDGDGFDFKDAPPTVTCPTDVSSTMDFVAGTASAAAVTINSVKYHVFECRYSGAGNAAQSFQSDPIIVTSLINPAPKSGHAVGTADAYNVIVQNMDSTYTMVDQTTAQIGVIESVRVSATVAPQITFKIAGIPSGALGNNACGSNTSVTTTATTVPFGEVAISSFSYAAQSLEVSTNAVGGYVVTAHQNDNLGKGGKACADGSFPVDCIVDTTGDGANITYGTKGRWDSITYKGFGYSLKKITSTGTAAFEYGDTDGNCVGGTFCAKQFADLENSEPSQTIFSSSTVADSENIDVCYKIVISNTQAAGDYENHVVYTATATF